MSLSLDLNTKRILGTAGGKGLAGFYEWAMGDTTMVFYGGHDGWRYIESFNKKTLMQNICSFLIGQVAKFGWLPLRSVERPRREVHCACLGGDRKVKWPKSRSRS